MRDHRRDYELMFIISPLQAHEEGVNAVVERLQQTITAEGGEVVSVNHSPPWGRRRLAYPIRAYAGGEASRRNFTEGYYVLMHFTLFASKVTEVERTLRLTDAVLRHLVTVVERKDRPDVVLSEEAEVATGDAEDTEVDDDEDEFEDYEDEGDGDEFEEEESGAERVGEVDEGRNNRG